MKKMILLIAFIIIILIIVSAIMLTKDNKRNLTHIRVAEVTHSVFYAPQYVSINEGFFKEEGLDIELVLRPGADKVAVAVSSGDVQIGLSGSEQTIYQYEKNQENYIQTFAGLTKRDGSLIVSREKIENFTLNNLKDKKIIGGREGGTPEMTFEWALRKNGIDIAKDVDIDTSIPFADMKGAFTHGAGDFVILFEPDAASVEKEGSGYVVASVGILSGETPYTSYIAQKAYIDNNSEIIKKFTRAIYKGLQFVKENDAAAIAESISGEFPDISIDELIKIIDRYKSQDVWTLTPVLTEESFNHLQEIMQAAGKLNKFEDFQILVNTNIAEEAIK